MPILDDPPYLQQWALEKIGLTEAKEQLRVRGGGKPVTVAIVDWGVQRDHQAFGDGLIVGAARTIPPKSDDCTDDSTEGHGTMLAGIIGGLVPGVQLLIVKFIDVHTTPSADNAAEAIEFALNHQSKPRVINASWDVSLDEGSLLEAAIEKARDQIPGVVVVTGAGNDGRNNDETPSLPATFDAERLSNLISVMASDENDEKPEFSNYGPQTVHLAAPGTGIISTTTYLGAEPPASPGAPYNPGYFLYNGTSAAAAFVSAAAAMLLSIEDKLTPQQVRDRLMRMAEDPNGKLQGLCKGNGRLNISRALRFL